MIHLYPGMGANASMYGPVWREKVPGHYHDWPTWRGESSIREWALRLVDEHSIQDGDTVIGSSLGGILACEIAKIRSMRHTVLIGSARHPQEISKPIRWLHPLLEPLPIGLAKAWAAKIPTTLCRMFATSDPAFLRAMGKAVFEWPGALPSQTLRRIHGSHDLLIPLPADADRVISGGHLIAMTEPAACIRALGID